MDSMKAPHVKKAKKKQVKDELDRIKQAEKKRRRLEKALATSAAIRSELEKKKQKKKEEQQRLDEEGAAMAEAVALHVLLGEDSDDMPGIVLDDENLSPWHHAPNTAFSHHDLKNCSFENISWIPSANPPYPSYPVPYFEEQQWGVRDISAEMVASRVISSLQIIEDGQVGTVFFNGY